MIRVEIYKDELSQEKMGWFLVPDNASKAWLERNIPYVIHAGQLFAGKTEPWDVKNDKNRFP